MAKQKTLTAVRMDEAIELLKKERWLYSIMARANGEVEQGRLTVEEFDIVFEYIRDDINEVEMKLAKLIKSMAQK